MDAEGLVMATGVMWGGGTPSQWQKESGSDFPSPEKSMNIFYLKWRIFVHSERYF